jgi:hypothetical protein
MIIYIVLTIIAMIYMNTMILTLGNFDLFIDNTTILIGMALFSPDGIREIIIGLKENLKYAESVEEFESIIKDIRAWTKELEEGVKEYKVNLSKEQKLEARRAKAAAKKEALQQFFKSDLYGIACSILGFDIKTKLKSIAMNSKWVTITNHPTVNPAEFTMNHFTLDIEAYMDEKGNFVPYMLGIYSPNTGYKSFFGLNCVQNALNHILNATYDTTEVTFYAHNGGKFDFIFLIKELNSHGIDSMRILKDKNNSIFNISFEHNGYSFVFKDSFKILPMSLDKLLKDFNIQIDGLVGKLPFNHNWVNASNLNYVGEPPEWVSHMEEQLVDMGVIINKKFSFQRYCEIYNRVDCEGLYNLIYKFFHTLVKEFKIDFSHCATLPQLAMELFRSVFLKSNKQIRLLSDRHYKFIKKSFYGSEVSVYRPYAEGKVYVYDVNSLYPYAMLQPLPISSPRPYDCSRGLKELFGFAEAIIEVPEGIKIPVLPLKANINGSEKLIFPTGTFRSVFFSEELRYAESLGYKIKLIKGLSFEKSNDLFYEYVQNFYNKKLNGKGAIKAISKLLLNTLYGRWAMNKEFESNFITSNEFMKDKLLEIFSNIKPEPLNEKSVLFNFSIFPNTNIKDPYIVDLLRKLFYQSNESRISNIAIASAITAYARIYMHQFKMEYSNELLYSDTDSLALANKPLNADLIGDKIGQFKNVLADENYTISRDADYYFTKGLFLPDKVYSIVLKDNTQITKFSGLNRKLIPSNCFELLYDAYLTGNPLKLKNELLKRDLSNLMVSHVELDDKGNQPILKIGPLSILRHMSIYLLLI